MLLRVLPEHAPVPSLYDFVQEHFISMDKLPAADVANFPLYFIIHCGRELGFDLKGGYSNETPYLDLQEGGFTNNMPTITPFLSTEDAEQMARLLDVRDYNGLKTIELNSNVRLRLIDWYITFLQRHTQHMASVRSLSILRTILH